MTLILILQELCIKRMSNIQNVTLLRNCYLYSELSKEIRKDRKSERHSLELKVLDNLLRERIKVKL